MLRLRLPLLASCLVLAACGSRRSEGPGQTSGPREENERDAGALNDAATASGDAKATTSDPTQNEDGEDAGSEMDGATQVKPQKDSAAPSEPEDTGPAPGDGVFVPGQVLDIAVTIDTVELLEIEEYGNEELYKPARVAISGLGIDGAAFNEVGFRHKGAYSLHHCWDQNGGVRSYEAECERLSYKIKFHEFVNDARLDGLKRLNLHAVTGGDARLRDLLAYQTFRDFGVDAPRTAPVRLTINGELVGLFIAVEAIDGRYTKAHYPSGADGNLYKEIWPQTNLDDEHFIPALRTNNDEPDVSDMQAFASSIAAASPNSLQSDLSRWLDINSTLRYIAVDRAMKNWDGIMTFYTPETSHNFYWYHDDGDDDRFHLIPWDLDGTFWEFDPYMGDAPYLDTVPVPDWNTEPSDCLPRDVWEPGSGTAITPPRCDTLLSHLAVGQWDEFADIAAELLAGPFGVTSLQSKVDEWEELLRPLVAEDPLLSVELWQEEVALLRALMPLHHDDFETFAAGGLRVEGEVQEPVPVDAGELNQTTANGGLLVGRVTNFEFATAPATEPAGVFFYGDDLALVSAFWNTVEPLSGSADLRSDFTFESQPEPWDEWVNFGIASAATDVTGYSEIIMNVRADTSRTVRIRILSDAYDEDWGEIWTEFGDYYAVGVEPTTLTLTLSSLVYPDWAKDSWEDGQGFTSTDAAALTLALTKFTGLVFNPEPTRDDDGQMLSAEESGFMQIDNIYFR